MNANRDFWTRAIIDQNYRWLVAYFLTATGNPQLAEDLTQEVFAAAIAGADRFDASRSLAAWLRGIARNLLLANYRSTKRAPVLCSELLLDQLDRIAAESQLAHELPDHGESRLAALRQCLEGLAAASGQDHAVTLWDPAARQVRQTFAHKRLVRMLAFSPDSATLATVSEGGTLWVLGVKTEGTMTVAATLDGGKSEFLGGWIYVIGKDSPKGPMFTVKEAQTRLQGIVQFHAPRKTYEVLVDETQAGTHRLFTKEANNGRSVLVLFASR